MSTLHVIEPRPGEVGFRVFRAPGTVDQGFVYIDGPGGEDLRCGHCARVLMRGVRQVLPVSDLLFQCPRCHSLNAVAQPR
ncbi:Com family DNA-binding transcriptional regulator [Nakamurella alba]|uniref:Com family DNA-binding transcriptional regulator n=1 Tax=Nakamurella alba TaxID=2665158 RepID=UPI0018A8EF62|nr:Com family DNA-binding transcriptional regulator [Nakamurella alba]